MQRSAKFHLAPPKMKSALKRIYLCGPMDQVSKNCSVTWRKTATNVLKKKNIQVDDPTGRASLSRLDLVLGDKKAIRGCQCLLAYAPKGVPFVGTSMEIFYASQVLRIPVIAWGEGNSTDPSPWVYTHSTFVCETLEEALDFILNSVA